MNSIFLGNRIESLFVLQKFTNVETIITNKGSYVDRQIFEKKRITYINKKNYKKIFLIIKNTKAKLILSVGFPKIIPEKFLPKNKFLINSHPSLLPKYKGYRPVLDAIKDKQEYLGVSTHFLSKELDSGKIISQKKFSLGKKKNPKQIYRLLFSIIEPNNLRKTLERFIKK